MTGRNWGFPIIEVAVLVIAAAATIGYFLRKKTKSHSTSLRTLVDPTAKYPLPLVEKEEISHDTRRFRFKLPTESHILGLPVGQHIILSAKINEELVIRSYTPTTSDDDQGYMDLIIKVYFANSHPKFPDGGKMSQYLNNLKIGETIDVRGPSGKLTYLGNGKVSVKNLRNEPPAILNATHINMIAGGTGITPMLQLVRHVTKNEPGKAKLALLFANQTERDILVREELEAAAKEFPDQFKLWYTVDTASEGWKYSTGFVNAEMIRDHLFPPSPTTVTLMCGPPPMINFACTPSLDSLGYEPKLRFAY